MVSLYSEVSSDHLSVSLLGGVCQKNTKHSCEYKRRMQNTILTADIVARSTNNLKRHRPMYQNLIYKVCMKLYPIFSIQFNIYYAGNESHMNSIEKHR